MAELGAVSGPRDAAVMEAILKEMGVEEYDPNVVHQMLEFSYRYITGVLEDARVYSAHAQKKEVDVSDIKLAVQHRMDHSFTSPPPREFLMEVAREKNATPLPLIPEKFGPRLPPERYCLTATNYKVKERQKPPMLAKPQVTLSATFKLPVTGRQILSPTVRPQLTSPLLTTYTPTTNMPSLAGLAGAQQNVLNLTSQLSSPSGTPLSSGPKQSMPTLTPLRRPSGSNTTSNNNNSGTLNMPLLGRLQ